VLSGAMSRAWGPLPSSGVSDKFPMNKRSGAIYGTLGEKVYFVNMVLCNVVIVFTFQMGCFVPYPDYG